MPPHAVTLLLASTVLSHYPGPLWHHSATVQTQANPRVWTTDASLLDSFRQVTRTLQSHAFLFQRWEITGNLNSQSKAWPSWKKTALLRGRTECVSTHSRGQSQSAVFSLEVRGVWTHTAVDGVRALCSPRRWRVCEHTQQWMESERCVLFHNTEYLCIIPPAPLSAHSQCKYIICFQLRILSI